MLHKVLATKSPLYSDFPPDIYMGWFKKTFPSSESTSPLSNVLPTFFTFLKDASSCDGIISELTEKQSMVLVGGSVWSLIDSGTLENQDDLDIRLFDQCEYEDLCKSFNYKAVDNSSVRISIFPQSFTVSFYDKKERLIKKIDVSNGLMQEPKLAHFSLHDSLMVDMSGRVHLCFDIEHAKLTVERVSDLKGMCFNPNKQIKNKPKLFLRYLLAISRGIAQKIPESDLFSSFGIPKKEVWRLAVGADSWYKFVHDHCSDGPSFDSFVKVAYEVTTEVPMSEKGDSLWGDRFSSDIIETLQKRNEILALQHQDLIKKKGALQVGYKRLLGVEKENKTLHLKFDEIEKEYDSKYNSFIDVYNRESAEKDKEIRSLEGDVTELRNKISDLEARAKSYHENSQVERETGKKEKGGLVAKLKKLKQKLERFEKELTIMNKQLTLKESELNKLREQEKPKMGVEYTLIQISSGEEVQKKDKDGNGHDVEKELSFILKGMCLLFLIAVSPFVSNQSSKIYLLFMNLMFAAYIMRMYRLHRIEGRAHLKHV